MITTIRSQFKQTTYRYVVFFMVFIFIFSMISSLFVKTERAHGGASWALRINGSEVSYQTFSREVAKESEFLARIKAQYGQYADLLFQSMGWPLDPKVRAIESLTKEALILQYGEKLGIKLHPDYITKVLNNAHFVKQHLGHIVPPFVYDAAGVLDTHIVNEFLRQRGMSAQQFEESIEKALIQLQVLEILSASAYTPSFDIKQYFIAQYVGKQFSYLTFSFDRFLSEEKKKTVTEEELQAFYDAQNTQFRRYWVPEKRGAISWKFEPENYNISLSDEEIQEYYEDNKVKSFILDPLKVEVQQLFLSTVAEATHTSIDEVEKALVHEKSKEFEKYWKSLKPFARGERKGELEKNSFLLQHEGEMSSVFETKEGKTIVRLVKRIPRTYKPLVTVKKEIESLLINKAFKKQFAKDIKNVLSQNNTNAMETFIVEKGGHKEVIAPSLKDETMLSQQLFSLKKGNYGFFVENGTGRAVLLTDVIERHLPDLASIKDIVKNDLYEHRARSTIKEKVAAAQKEAQNKTFDALKNQFNVSLNATDMFSAQDNKKLQDMGKKGLPVHEMLSLEKEGSIITHYGDRNSFIVKLDKIEQFDQDKLLAVYNEVKNHVGTARMRMLLDGVVASLHRNATIETNESILIMSEDYSE